MAISRSGSLIQVKASGMMCSFCTMSVEKALSRMPCVKNVQVNLVHGIILADADPLQVSEADVARKVEELGYTVVATEAQQYRTDEALFATIKRRSMLAMLLAVLDLLLDPLDILGLPRADAGARERLHRAHSAHLDRLSHRAEDAHGGATVRDQCEHAAIGRGMGRSRH